jgi:hypothetical protein
MLYIQIALDVICLSTTNPTTSKWRAADRHIRPGPESTNQVSIHYKFMIVAPQIGDML